jgi:two-component system NtrC family sensor kinase
MRRTLLHLLVIYLLPFIMLTIYFHIQTLDLRERSHHWQLQSVAEYQAHMLDLFIRERAVNLANLVDDPILEPTHSQATLQMYLEDLQRDSDTFVDVGVFDAAGVQVGYAGPFAVLAQRDYSAEHWFQKLQRQPDHFVITDIYLGFRQRPHFTIAVSRSIDERFCALRATLDPDRIYGFITSLEGARELRTTIVNQDGTYQFVTPGWGTPLAESSIIPPREPRTGIDEVEVDGQKIVFGYSWLAEAGWALITQRAEPGPNLLLLGGDIRLAAVALLVVLAILTATIIRARKRVRIEEERDETKVQLEHATKLASVGELASGIAHEINNPLAIISEEAGLIKDLMDPEFGKQTTFADLTPHLDTIHEAVFRCRDITRKLLGFVRRTEFSLDRHSIPELMDEVVDDFFVRKLAVSNIEIHRNYADDIPEVTTDGGQLQQVFLNIINNASDAIEGAGRITLRIHREEEWLRIAIGDDGVGMTREQLGKIFMPFYTTKEVGKGTGLGLSVSYGIIESLGGNIEVASEPGRGSTFTIVLPIR